MNRIRPMPDKEKFQYAWITVRKYHRHVLPFVAKRLGQDAMLELSSVWQAGMMPVRKESAHPARYQAAYNNWLWMARCSHDFIADQMKGDEIVDYKRLLLKLYKSLYDNPALIIHRMLGNYGALIKSWIYQMQWMTPIELSSKKNGGVGCAVHECRVLQTPATERICRVDCRNVGKAVAREIYYLNRETTMSDQGCTIELSPLETWS